METKKEYILGEISENNPETVDKFGDARNPHIKKQWQNTVKPSDPYRRLSYSYRITNFDSGVEHIADTR